MEPSTAHSQEDEISKKQGYTVAPFSDFFIIISTYIWGYLV